MIERKPSILEFNKRISRCKTRLDKIKNKGFIFSKRIYYDLDSIEKKLIKQSLFYRIWDKKISIVIGIVFIISIILILNFINNPLDEMNSITFPPSKNMDLNVINISDKLIINESFIINGTANHSNGDIRLVQIKIDNKDWMNASGTNDWNYFLNINDLINGSHFLSFRCWDGEVYSEVENIQIFIQKKVIIKPILVIQNPKDGDRDLSGVVYINGTAKAGTNEIDIIEIQFDKGSWENVTGIYSWQKNWNTNEFNNGQHYIRVRCRDILGYSNSTEILVTIFNDRDEEFEYPDYESGFFQIFFINTKSPLMIPGKNYSLDVYHRRTEVNIFKNRNTIKTTLEIREKPTWLKIYIPKDTIITYPDNQSNVDKIYLSISDDAPMDKSHALTIYYNYYPANIDQYQIIKNLLYETYSEDVTIYTGQW
jgi:hypothetical protein